MIEQKLEKVACCASIATQHATNEDFSATLERNINATNSLKSLAGAILERNSTRNTSATDTPKHAQQIGQKNSEFVAQSCAVVAHDLTESEADYLRAWLAHINETDQATIQEVLDKCACDPDALDYFLGRALAEAQLPLQTKPVAVSCQSCQHFRPFHIHGKGSGTCRAGVRPSGLVHWSETPKQCVLYQGKQ